MDYQYESHNFYHHQQPQQHHESGDSGGTSDCVGYDHGSQSHHVYHHHRAEVSQQISRHHDLERGLDRMTESQSKNTAMGPFLAQVVMEECREAKIRRQNRQVAISAGVAIGLIVAVIWFVVTR